MATGPEKTIVPPSETRGGNAPDADEVARKGDWAGNAAEGIVRSEHGASSAPLAPGPELGGSVLGQTASSNEPATGSGVDSSAGDEADATTSGAPSLPVGDVDPAIRDSAMNAMQAVRDYAATKRA